MPALPGRLGKLSARDVMTSNIITLIDTDTLEDAVTKLKASRITGAPVVNSDGKFIGILSISDLLKVKPSTANESDSPTVPLAHGDDATSWDLFERVQPLDQADSAEKISDRMSRQVTSVAEHTPLVDVARVMCGGHWHRVPVVDETGKLSGIISTMDVLAALVNVADEER